MSNLLLRAIEVGGLLCVTLVVRSPPRGPFAGAFAGARLGQPDGPDVGEGTGCSRQVCDSQRWALGIATILSVGLVRSLWARVINWWFVTAVSSRGTKLRRNVVLSSQLEAVMGGLWLGALSPVKTRVVSASQ